MDVVHNTIGMAAAQFTIQQKKGMFVAVATPISAAIFALIGYAETKAHTKALSISFNSNRKWLNSQVKLTEQKVRFNTAIVKLANKQSGKCSDEPNNTPEAVHQHKTGNYSGSGTKVSFYESHLEEGSAEDPPGQLNSTLQMLAQQILRNQLDDHHEQGYNAAPKNIFQVDSIDYPIITNRIIKLAFVGGILPAAILALYEKGAVTLATETLQVISNLGAKALRNRGTSICLIVALIAFKYLHDNASKHDNSYFDELSQTGKGFLSYIPVLRNIPGLRNEHSSRTYYERGSNRENKYPKSNTSAPDQNQEKPYYPVEQSGKKTGWFSWLPNWTSTRRNSNKTVLE